MSHFLQNLIARHQEKGINQDISDIVQPRAKARFEVESGTEDFTQNDHASSYEFSQSSQFDSESGSTMTRSNSDTTFIVGAKQNQSSPNTQISAQQSIDRLSNQPDSGHDIDKPENQSNSSYRITDFNERMEALTLQLGQKSPVLKTPDSTIENKFYQQIENRPESELPENTTSSHNQELSLTDEFNHRIQMILYRLNTQQQQQKDDQIITKSHQEFGLSNIDNNTPVGAERLPQIPETISDSDQPAVKVREQNIENRSEQRQSPQSGLLQTPGWLNEMQAGLNKRWQEINTHTEPEPVINVTIGRVEVKAVQAESTKQSKSRNKPSGVMSLDEYLKKRENRGRA